MTGLSIYPPLLKKLTCFEAVVDSFVSELPVDSKVVVAFSGGLDSTVLLHLLSRVSVLRDRLSAHYIDHGLQPVLSKEWSLHCQSVCEALSIPFTVTGIEIGSTKRKGVEAAARKLRYKALTQNLVNENAVLVTGHHQRDQAETLLLNLARGAGVAGLSAMPISKGIVTEQGVVRHSRPLLSIPYDKFLEYAEFFGLEWVEDPSNQSVIYKRNVVRHELLPVLKKHWPSIEKTLSQTAQNMSEAQQLLDKMACRALGEQINFSGYLDLKQHESLEWLELKNLIRYWLFKRFSLVLSVKHYEWMLGVLECGGESRQGRFSYQLGQGELCFYKKRLYYRLAQPAEYYLTLDKMSALFEGYGSALLLGGEQSLRSVSVWSFNWPVSKMAISRFKIRSISQDDEIDNKKLKRFFQSVQVPSWERKFWPVLECDDKLVSVLGCIDCLDGVVGTVGNGQRLSLTQEQVYRLLYQA